MNLFIKNLNVRVQECGSKWVVAMDGRPKDINLQFNSFYNWGATNGKLHWHHKTRAIFHTNEKKLLRCLTNMAESKLLDKQYPHAYFFEGEKGEAKAAKVAPSLAAAEMKWIERVPWIVKYENYQTIYSVGDISACFDDDDSVTSRNQRKERIKEMSTAVVDAEVNNSAYVGGAGW